MISLLSYCFFFKTRFFFSQLWLRSPLAIYEQIKSDMYRCYNCCPCILPPILLFRLFRSVTPIGLSWFKTTPPLPLSLFRFFSLLSLQICLFPSAPIFRFHTILVFFSLFFVVPFFLHSLFFLLFFCLKQLQLKLVSSIFLITIKDFFLIFCFKGTTYPIL